MFTYRIILLLSLMLIISLVDLYRNGARATRFREYGFILITGAMGGGVGLVNDLITSSISPDYFILGKGLQETPDLRMQAGLFGLRVGFSAGVIGGALCLYASRRKSPHPPLQFFPLFQALWMPVLGAILCAILLPLALSRFDPARLSVQLDTMISAEKIARFRQVWWAHVGLYAGLVIGLALMIFHAVKERRSIGSDRLGQYGNRGHFTGGGAQEPRQPDAGQNTPQ
jgi:ABC-type cobalt transport system substrate-binding protein